MRCGQAGVQSTRHLCPPRAGRLILGGVACPLLGAVHATSSNPAALEGSEVRIHERTPVGRRWRQDTVQNTGAEVATKFSIGPKRA